jgi:hypothetical protein
MEELVTKRWTWLLAWWLITGCDAGAAPARDGNARDAGSGGTREAGRAAAGQTGAGAPGGAGSDAGTRPVRDGGTMASPGCEHGSAGSAADACATDADCGLGARCACDAIGARACVAAKCFGDGDCDSGQRCQRSYSCGLPVGPFLCSTAQDECESSADCDRGVCHFEQARMLWACQVLPPCTS